MQATVPIALFGWLIVVIGLFTTLKPHRAVIAAVLGGYLFLPKARWTIASGIPDWSSDCSISMYTLACALAFAPVRITAFRPSRLDAIIGLGFASWGLSSIVAGFGIKQAVPDWWFYLNWAVIPYFLARCYITTPDELRDLAMGLLIALAIYAPLVLFETRFYPWLNKWVYGWQPDRGGDIARMGGIRPIVFMQRGLALAIWIGAAAVVVCGLWLSGRPRSVRGLPMIAAAAAAVILGLITRSGGAIGLMLGGLAVLLAIRATGMRRLAIAAPLGVALYLATGMFGNYLPIREAATRVAEVVYPARAFSLEVRFNHEAVLASRAREELLLGHGGWGTYRDIDAAVVAEATGRRQTVTDGFWIIVFGQRGLIGVATVFGWMLVPATLAIWLVGRRGVPASLAYMVIGLSLWSSLYAADLLLNGFVSPVQGLIAGSLATLVASARSLKYRRKARLQNASILGGVRRRAIGIPVGSAGRVQESIARSEGDSRLGTIP